jgi:hypothetical protein
MPLVIHHGPMRFKGGPLDGKKYVGGGSGLWAVDKKKRLAWCYHVTYPPHRGLRTRRAMCVLFSCGPLTRAETRIVAGQPGAVEVDA